MYQISQLLKYKKLFHAFSQRSDGNMANSINGVIHDFNDVLDNRKRFLEGVGVDINNTICMWVMHGNEIVEADIKLSGVSMFDYQKAVKVDGFYTNKKGIYLFLLIADCLPIVIYDPVRNAVALVHAGWKGVDSEIAKNAVFSLIDKYDSDPKDLIVGIGPCVYKKSFIKETPSQIDDPQWKDYLKPVQKNMYSVDLVGFTKKQFFECGVLRDNIFESGIDTTKNNNFFSYVRDGKLPIDKQGRFACVVGLK